MSFFLPVVFLKSFQKTQWMQFEKVLNLLSDFACRSSELGLVSKAAALERLTLLH